MTNMRGSGARGQRAAIVKAGFLSLILLWCLAPVGQSAQERRAASPRADAESPSASTAADDADSAPDEGEPETDDDFSDLRVPSETLAKVKTIDRMKFLQELRGLLAEGIPERGDGSGPAKRRFEALRRIAAGDPRGPYAYGVALLAQKKPKEALEQFRAAVQTKVPYLPALQAAARSQVVTGDLSKALAGLSELAKQVEDAGDSPVSDQGRERSAEWLGRMMGYLAGPGKSAGAGADIDRLEKQIDGLLTGDRKVAYERGRNVVAARYEEFQALARRPPDELRNEVKRKTDEIAGLVKAAEDEVQRLEEEINGIKRPLDKEVAAAQREIRVHGPKVKRCRQGVEETTALVADLSVPRKYPASRSSSSTASKGRTRTTTTYYMRSETNAERQAREAELAAAKESLKQLQASLEYSSERYDEALRQRDEAKAEIKRATADLVSELSTARRKRQELAARARIAEQTLLTPENLQLRLTAIDTYLPFDPAAEKTRLLATLKPR